MEHPVQSVYQKKISICLNRGREESLGNDDVSIVRARKYELAENPEEESLPDTSSQIVDWKPCQTLSLSLSGIRLSLKQANLVNQRLANH